MNKSIYTLEYLPLALQDMKEIIYYISHKLCNPSAASKLYNAFTNSAEKTVDFPYSNSVYQTIKPLDKEYRRIYVENYIMFYWIDETTKTVTIARVIYCRRDYTNRLV